MADVNVRFGATIGDVVDACDRISEKLKSIGEPVDALNEKFTHLAEIAGISLSVEGLKSFVESMAELGEKTESRGAVLGISAQQVGELSGVAKLAGTDFDTMAAAIERASLNVQRSTRSAFSPAGEALKALGLNARDLIGLPTDQYFAKVADAVARFKPSLNLTTLAMQAFGGGIKTLLPTLEQGGAHFLELEEKARAAGATLTQAQAHAFGETAEKLHDLALSAEGLGIKFFDVLRPGIDAAVTSLTKFVQSFTAGDIRDAANKAGTAIIDFGVAVAKIFIDLKAKWESFVSIFHLPSIDTHGFIVPEGQEDIIDRLSAKMRGLFAKIEKMHEQAYELARFAPPPAEMNEAADLPLPTTEVEAATKAVDDLGTHLKTVLNANVPPSGTWEAQRAEIALFISDLKAADDAKNKLDAPATNFGARDAIAAAMIAVETQIEKVRAAYDRLKISETSAVATFQESEDRKTADLLAALKIREAAVEKLYADEAKLAGGIAAKAEEIEKRKTAALDAIYKERESLEAQQLKKNTQEWESAGNTIVGAWNSQLRGLLARTESWATAMKNITADLVLKTIEGLEEIAVKQAAVHLASAVGGGPQSLLGSLVGGAGGGAQTAAVTANTTALATLTSAILGKTAASTAEATTSAAAGAGGGLLSGFSKLFTLFGIPALEVGGFVMSPGLAMLHRNETIVPAGVSTPYQGGTGGGAGGGATHVHNWNVSAVDARSFANLINGNSNFLAQAVARQFQNNPTLAAKFS